MWIIAQASVIRLVTYGCGVPLWNKESFMNKNVVVSRLLSYVVSHQETKDVKDQ